jgi:poly(A) polymerase
MASPAESFARRIVQRLQSAGHTAYFAGGCVRDQLMGRPPKDYDVATSATPDQVLALFPRGQQVGAAFGVILLVEKHQGQRLQVEVATFRSDGTYSDGRHPDAVHFTTAEIDAQRRDFTCNGLFLDPLAHNGAGQLHDFVGGQADIQSKILRAIGDPAARFQEDHLRMLRAVRFAARLGFQIEEKTRTAIVQQVHEIKGISNERIGEEMRMMLAHPARLTAVQLLSDTSLLYRIWPDIWRRSPSSWNTLAALTGDVSRAVGLAAIHVDLWDGIVPRPWGPSNWTMVANLLKVNFVLSNDEQVEVAWIGETAEILFSWPELTRAALKRRIAHPYWPAAFQLHQAWSRDAAAFAGLLEKIARFSAEGVAPAPFITGDTLIKLGASPGPNFKRWLDTLYDRQLELELTTKDQALAAAKILIASG